MIRPKAKKHFGQHFLTNSAIAVRMADQLQGAGSTYHELIEIGPGKGILTRALLERHPEISLRPVEVDQDMVVYLIRELPFLESYLIQKDFLTLDIESDIGNQQVGIVGNFPYNISSQIIFKMLAHVQQIPELVGMFQKEVAERLVAPPGSKTYGILSVLIRTYYTPAMLFKLKPGSFDPPPKVQSAVIQLVRHTQCLEGIDEALYFQVVKKAFNQRRKKLRNSLKDFVENVGEVLPEHLLEKRPEALNPADFQEITIAISKVKNTGKTE